MQLEMLREGKKVKDEVLARAEGEEKKIVEETQVTEDEIRLGRGELKVMKRRACRLVRAYLLSLASWISIHSIKSIALKENNMSD